MATARDAVLAAFRNLERRTGRDVFDRAEIVREVLSTTTAFRESTIRTYVTSVLCSNAPVHHPNHSNDLVRVEKGRYRRILSTDDLRSLQSEADRIPSRATSHGPRHLVSRSERVAAQSEALVASFRDSLKMFVAAHPFTGPSIHFHLRAIERVRQLGDVEAAVHDVVTVDLVYATLASWGMHRMGPRGAKLVEYDMFAEALRRHSDALAGLQGVRINDLDAAAVSTVCTDLWRIIAGLSVSATESQLVAGSKTLHHFLPDLVPPIDRQYTGQFYYGLAGKSWNMGEEAAFAEMFPEMVRISQRCGGEIDTYLAGRDPYMGTSVSKVIDNAIVGFVLAGQRE